MSAQHRSINHIKIIFIIYSKITLLLLLLVLDYYF